MVSYLCDFCILLVKNGTTFFTITLVPSSGSCSVHPVHASAAGSSLQLRGQAAGDPNGGAPVRPHGPPEVQVMRESNKKDRQLLTSVCVPRINQKIPRGPPSPPAPVMHSPTRKVTVKEQKEWKIPPCISNWKNAKVSS